jgi:hemerythrin-like metal-binding protein
MSLITWTDDLSVTVPDMDAQHKRLIALINQLHDAMKNRQGKDAVGKTLEGLRQYTISHFRKEEELMKAAAYPKLPQQLTQHKAFVDKITRFQQDFDSGKTTLSIDLMNYLRDWLTGHIKQEDKAYGPYLGKGAKVGV